MKYLEWIQSIQKLGRIQIPTEYLRTHGIKEGDIVVIKQTSKDGKLMIIIGGKNS